ncbi:MAG TPA: aminotransferase class V-fold PLP-dependent enzyme [Elainellaceae cyanobacterium]
MNTSFSSAPSSEPSSTSENHPYDVRHHWLLDPEVTFLNHGSFGACPISVLERQQILRQQLEREPVQFVERELETLFDDARDALATFVGTQAANLAFVPNATHGVNTVLRSLSFQPGDEVLVTNHEYNACRNALEFVANRSGATIVVVPISLPLTTSDIIVERVLSHVSPKTKLALLDHVTSPTAIVMPIQRLVSELNQHGIATLIDGAHAPGMVPLMLDQLGADYYTGNCHKWLCAPKGAAFLYVRPDRQSHIHPLAISHGANAIRGDRSRFHLEFDWVGTTDPTPYLCVPDAIQFMGSLLPGGWHALMHHNHQLVLAGRTVLAKALHNQPPIPDDLIGSMAVLSLPNGEAASLHRALFARFKIEVPVIPWTHPSQRLIRISAQIYNTLAEYERLAEALTELLESEAL